MSDQHFPIKTVGPFPQNPTVSALRADDFLSLQFEFVNLQVSTPSPDKPVLTIVNPAESGFIIVSFPPQNIAEQAFWLAADEPGKALPVPPPPDQPPYPPATELPDVSSVALCRIAGASRLVFIVPSNAVPIPYGLQSLLEKCSEFALSVAPTAKILASFPPILHPAATGVLATSTLASVRATPAVPLASLMVQHRAAMLATRSLTFKTFGGAVAASTIAHITSAGAGPAPLAPTATETAIEMPYRLIISPNQCGAWAHASVPVSSESGRTELWHTRLGCRGAAGDPIDESARTQRPFRNISAIWARDQANFPATAPPHDQIRSTTSIPFRASLDTLDRWNIVHQSRGFSDIVTNRLMLTSLGGWLDAQGTWPGEAVEEWRHVATMGRDHYARVVYKGFLFPFGHRASLVKITERMFYPTISGYLGNRAYLRQRIFVVVREQDKFYFPNGVTDAAGARFDLQMPFQRVRITTMATPNLDAPALKPPSSLLDTLSCFCPRVGGNDFKFHLIAEDLEGNEIEFSAPLYFLDATRSGDCAPSKLPDHLDDIISKYWTMRGICDFQGRRVPFAESSDSNNPGVIKPGSTTFETASVIFSAARLDDTQVGALGWECHFYPKVVAANIIVPALKHLAGNAGQVRVNYDPVYRQHGFDPVKNKGQVFVRMSDPNDPNGIVSFAQQGDRSGGLVKPNMQMTALSRLLGPVAGDPAKISGGTFDPTDFFSKVLDGTLLFGTIPLSAVLQTVVGFDHPSKLPRFVTEAMTKLDGLLQDVAAAADLVKTVSGQLDSSAAGLQAEAKAVTADLDALTTDLQELVKDPKNESVANDFVPRLQTFVNDLQKLLGDLPAQDATADAKRRLQQILSRFQQEVSLAESIIGTLLAEQLTIKFEWNPVIQSWPSNNPLFVPMKPNDGFKISVEMQVAKTAPEPAIEIYCALRDFKLQLIPIPLIGPFVTLHFDILEFMISTGKSPDVNVKLGGIEFDGCLSFVNTLEQLIPLEGFSDPPALSVTAAGIAASYSLGPLPTIPIGVFLLQNVSLGAGFRVPFVVDPLEIDFNFCTREQPFLLTVTVFGGGGYFLMKATPKDIYVEAALEFGAAVSVNLGTATGGVYVLAGIMFAMDGDAVHLSGFLRMGGNVSVLGLISMSIELDMDLNWVPELHSVIGQATITVEVSVLFFSEAVSISCQKQFAGSPPPPASTPAMTAARPAVLAPAALSPAAAHAPATAHPPAAALAPAAAHAPAAVATAQGGAVPISRSATAPPPPPPTFKDLMQPDGARFPWRDYCRAFA